MYQHSYPGRFIVFEGPDGAGSRFQAENLAETLTNKDKTVWLTEEPYEEVQSGNLIREILQKKELDADPDILQKLYIKNRREHLEEIEKHLEKGETVICSRYFFSTVAYGEADGLNKEDLLKANEDFMMPDLIYLMKLDVDQCIDRIVDRGNPTEKFETREYLEKVIEYYDDLKNLFPEITRFINAEPSKEDVAKEIRMEFKKMFSGK